MSKINRKFSLLKSVYFKAIFIVSIYLLLSKIVMLYSVSLTSIFYSYFIPIVYGIFFSVVFLYVFNNDNLFRFAKIIEKRQMKREKAMLNRFHQYSKPIIVVLISLVGGPILGSLTAHLFDMRNKFNYFFVGIANIPSAIFWVSVWHGTISLF